VEEHGGAHGTGTEFRSLAEEVSGEDLRSFFSAWLDTGAKPAATVENGLA
jgi:aminopeptidase N